MSFPPFESNDQKVYLNLSHYADTIINNDMETFGSSSKSGFINRIFTNFYEDAQASVERNLDAEKSRLLKLIEDEDSDFMKQLREKKVSKKVIKNIMKKFSAEIILQKQNDLTALAASYGDAGPGKSFRTLREAKPAIAKKAVGMNIRLNNQNYEYLVGKRAQFSCREDKYYDGSAGRYVTAVIEEYSRLPLPRRSKIYFRDILYIIQSACNKSSCDNQRILEITLHSDQLNYVHPYRIETDPTSGHMYLTGYRAEENRTGKMVALRLSKIRDVRILKKSSSISADKQSLLEKAIHDKGCAYINSGDAVKIEILLTPRGKELYHSLSANRPVYTETDGDKYKFHCTAYQILTYFFKFGKEAKVTEPEALAARFKERFEEAAAQYKK